MHLGWHGLDNSSHEHVFPPSSWDVDIQVAHTGPQACLQLLEREKKNRESGTEEGEGRIQ